MESTPEFFQRSKVVVSDHFVVEDLLDFPNDDEILVTDDMLDVDFATGTSMDSSFSGSNNINQESQFPSDIGCQSFNDGHFSGEFSVPYDDLAELEWLSTFVEESFSSDDLQKLHFTSGMKAQADETSATHQCHSEPNRAITSPILRHEICVPAKARSKRSRAAPCNWESRLMVFAPSTNTTPTTITIPTMSSPAESDVTSNFSKKKVKTTPKKKESYPNSIFAMTSNSEGRKCLHCATDKTPQWRTGPMGPKTLCNACGVRYKSGRLVPEYRPAASPTFVLTKHSNSHRKVVEIRRQKELLQVQQHQQQFFHQNMMFDVSNGDDYLIHQRIGPDFRHLI
ncbi:GATA transcription factor 9-like [Lycium barbarum]|uniref:GATA transcription factor 9-like n=1 Tax=Lycium barbarum TaxID=112863 RepID=UPI00293F4413|nr:GATA transcription factor 9-like [Lycium barbarum]